MEADPTRFTNRPRDGEADEGALERNLLANKFILFFTMQASFPTIRDVTHKFQTFAILKLPKLVLHPLAAITTTLN
jgi:hypothetical protein